MSLTLTGAGAGSEATFAYQTAVLADSPINYWRLGETSGTNAADIGSAPVAGTYTASPTLGATGATSDGNKAVTFTAASAQYVQIKSGTIIATLTNSSVDAWVKWTSGAGAIYCERGATGNAIWKFEVNNLGNLFTTHRDDAGTLNQFDSGATLTAGVYTHVAITKVGTAVRFYKNGVLSSGSPFALTGNDTLSLTSVQSRIASDAADPADYWNGTLDEVALYNTGLSAARVLAHFNAA